MSATGGGSGTAGRVCVLGSLNMDMIANVARFPAPGETLLCREALSLPGGKGLNQAVAAARAGADVTMLGAVGDDGNGRDLLRAADDAGVDTTCVMRRSGSATGAAMILVSQEQAGENMIVVAGGANQSITPGEVDAWRGMIGAAEVLLMQLECPLDVLVEAAGLARAAGRAVVLNAAPAQAGLGALLARTDVLVINRSEAAGITGLAQTAEPGALLRAAANLGPRMVVLTLGAAGAEAQVGTLHLRVPAFEVQSVDTVAAGDAFVGTLAACLARAPAGGQFAEHVLIAALTRASAAGALATTRRGALPSLPHEAEVEALIARQPRVTARRV